MTLGKRLAAIIAAVLLIASCSSTKPFVSAPASSVELSLCEKLEAYGGKSVRVSMPEMVFDGTEAMERLTSLIEEAEDYILISTFLGSSCPSLEGFYDALMDASERGVRVYFIMDGISSYDMTESQYHMTPLYFLRDRGVNLVEYSPVTATHVFHPSSLMVRDHRKLFVFDGKIAVIGGMNTNYISMGAGEGKTQRDSLYFFRSASLASLLADEFISIWNSSSVEKISGADFQRYEDGEGRFDAYLFNKGKGSEADIAGMYSSLIHEAKESILILPYLPVLDKNMEASIKEAAGRGVTVHMLMPLDSREYTRKGLAYCFPKLLDTGMDIYYSAEDENGNELPLLHEKLMIVDSRFVVIGSSNFNYRSMGLSHELALVIDSKELASMLEKHVEDVGKNAQHLTREESDRMKKEDSSFLLYLFMYYGG